MKRILLIVLGCLLLIPTAGCWSERELEKLAVVSIIGYDKITVDGQKQYQVTDRILNPSSSKSADTSTPTEDILLTGTGSTIQETSREATLNTPRQPYFGQTEAVIVGEDLAKEGLKQMIELLGRYPEIRLRTYLMVAKGTAYDVLNSKPEMNETLSREILDMADNKKLGISYNQDLSQYFQNLTSDDREAVCGVIEKTKSPTSDEDRIKLVGLAAFKDDKLIGYLNVEETIGYRLIGNNFKNGRTPIAVHRSDKEMFTYLLRSSKCKIIPEVQTNSIHFKIMIETTGDVDEVSGIEITPESIPSLEDEVGQRLSEMAQQTIDKAQGFNSDFIGFAYWLHRKNPKAWQEWKSKWEETFPNVTYEISIAVNIDNNGGLSKNIKVSTLHALSNAMLLTPKRLRIGDLHPKPQLGT
ncbi:MAG: Ger(x)C family spore germination protein [Bacillota bacterium]|nr:Ger(x)C family spore germination protein [Bacillota bacterium]